jgi:hypothetical protein
MIRRDSFSQRFGMLCFVACAISAISLSACGKETRRKVFPVYGRVLNWNMDPVSGAAVTFIPVDSKEAERFRPQGIADENGSFMLTTYEKGDGAPEGEYLVIIELRLPREDPFDSVLPPDILLGRYSDPKSSKHRFRIENKSDNVLPPIILD